MRERNLRGGGLNEREAECLPELVGDFDGLVLDSRTEPVGPARACMDRGSGYFMGKYNLRKGGLMMDHDVRRYVAGNHDPDGTGDGCETGGAGDPPVSVRA